MAIIINGNNNSVGQFVEQHKRTVDALYRRTFNDFKNLAGGIWANKQHTPEQILEAYGADGAELFRLSNLLASLYQEITGQPLQVVPNGIVATVNEDGTVSITREQA